MTQHAVVAEGLHELLAAKEQLSIYDISHGVFTTMSVVTVSTTAGYLLTNYYLEIGITNFSISMIDDNGNSSLYCLFDPNVFSQLVKDVCDHIRTWPRENDRVERYY